MKKEATIDRRQRVLIANVLQSMPIHLLSAVNPPSYVISKLHKSFAQLFWSSSIGGTSRHWASWNTLCISCKEGGIGFRFLHDVSKHSFASCGGLFELSQACGALL